MSLFDDAFSPEADSRVPGELVLTLSTTANQTAEAAAATSAAGDGTASAAATLGIAAVDAALAALQPVSVDKVHDEVAGSGVSAVDGTDASAELVGELGATYLVKYNPEVAPDDAIAALGQLPEVVDVEPNYFAMSTLIPNDTDWTQQWGPRTINCPEAWDTATGTSDVIVAVVDSGVDLGHPDLQGQLLAGNNFVDIHGGAKPGFHFTGRLTPDNNPQDEVGHGTHVAGIIGALGNNGTGVAGVVWGCKILPVRVLARIEKDGNPSMASGSGTAANIAAGIRWAADQGAKIINMSLGGYANAKVERNAVAYARAKGVLVICAMGNDHTSTPMYPAAFPGVVAVGSIGQTDARSSFSNTGAHLAICAPGEAIHNTFFDYPSTTSTYADLSGTSMATPHVAGVAALIWSADTSKTSEDVTAALTSSARVLPTTDPTQVGAGCVDCVAALRVIVPQVISGPDPETAPVDPNPVAVADNDAAATDTADLTSQDQPAEQPA